MLAAIEFDDDAFFETDEIDDKITDRLLPSEFYAVQLSGPSLLHNTASA